MAAISVSVIELNISISQGSAERFSDVLGF